MPLKIENKLLKTRFLTLSVGVTGLFSLLTINKIEIFVLFGIWLATLLNFYFLVMLVGEIKKVGKKEKKLDKVFIIFLGLGKLAILIGALTLGVHYVENRIIIPLLNYVVQIFILCISYLSYQKAKN